MYGNSEKVIMKRIKREWKTKVPKNTAIVDVCSVYANPFILRDGYISYPKKIIYNGRIATSYGSPWTNDGNKTQQDVIDLYELWITNQLEDSKGIGGPPNISILKGYDLATYTPIDQPCHSDVIIKLLTMTGQQVELDFHNTINESGERLTELKKNAKTQQEKILQYFFQNSIYCFTPFEIQAHVLPNNPITSIRRAITNLTTQGHLIKDSEQKVEKYGVKNNYWSFNANGPHGNKYKES